MTFGIRQKFGFSGILMLAAISVLAISVALVGIPAMSQWSGMSEAYVTYIAAGICFVVAIVASRLVKKMTAAGES